MTKAMSPNHREIISAQSTITGRQEYLSSTNGILNVNASVSISGSAIPVSGATTAIVTAIVDGSGNQITSFGGGTQYTDGGVPPAHPVGNTIEWSDGSNWQTVSAAKPLPVTATFSPSGTQDINVKQVSGTATSVNNGAVDAGTQRVTIANDSTGLIKLATGANAIGSITNTTFAATQGTAANLNATVVGTGTFVVQATLAAETTKVIGTVNQGTSPWVTSNATTSVVGNGTATTAQRVTLANDSTGVIATVGAVTAITNALPAGSNVIGHVIVDTGSTTTVTQGTATNLKTQAETYQGGSAVGSGNPLQVTLANTGSNATAVNVSGTVNPTTPSTLVSFVTTVTTAGTRVQLASNAIVAGVLEAPSTNTGLIYVGGATVSGTVFGAELQPGQSTGIQIDNTNKLYIDSSVNGNKCAFIGS